jgi:hypothetical protein
VISCFWLVLDLVLVFVGFGLFQIRAQLPFSPHSKDHVLHYILVIARYERRLECRLWVRGKHVISNLVTVVQRVTMATSFPLASISSFQLRAPWLIANASRRPLSLLTHPPLPFQLGPLV